MDLFKNMESKELSFKIEPITCTELVTYDSPDANDGPTKVRLDKWLWAARFFKTRALARSAIEQGRVLYDGQKSSPTKEIDVGVSITLNLGNTRRCIVIKKLSTRRRNSEEASSLFAEVQSRKSVKFLRSGNIHRHQSHIGYSLK